jgi:hypothetical protein
MTRPVDGICFWDPRLGVWTGTFIDSESKESIKACLDLAEEVSGLITLPADGHVVCVRLVVDSKQPSAKADGFAT